MADLLSMHQCAMCNNVLCSAQGMDDVRVAGTKSARKRRREAGAPCVFVFVNCAFATASERSVPETCLKV